MLEDGYYLLVDLIDKVIEFGVWLFLFIVHVLWVFLCVAFLFCGVELLVCVIWLFGIE